MTPGWSRPAPPPSDREGTVCDPYLHWADRTQWRGYRRLTGQLGVGGEAIDEVRLLVQLPEDWPDSRCQAVIRDAALWQVAPVYADPVPGATAADRVARHFTATLSRAQLAGLPAALRALQGGDRVRWELALPVRDAETTARAVELGQFGRSAAKQRFRMDPSHPVSRAIKAVAPWNGRHDWPKDGPRGTLAVIDFGCPFLNDSFADATGGTRIVALWDQGSQHEEGLAVPWTDARCRMGYGRVLSHSAMNALCAEVRGGSQGMRFDEGDVYRRLDYLIDYDDPRRRIWGASHGSHVASIAAGAPDPLAPPDRDWTADDAGQARIVFVQLPSLTGADCAGGSLGAQVLDALRFALDVSPRDEPLVVNLSYGSFAGPHDGSALVEQAIDELVAACCGRLVVVLGAGNSRQAQCHVRRRVRTDRSVLLRIAIEAGDYTDTFVETWFDPTPADGAAWKALRMRCRTAEGDWCTPIAAGQCTELVQPRGDRPIALMRLDARVPNGARPLALLCLSPTARPADDDGPLAPAGAWEIELFFDPSQQPAPDLSLGLDAWVERDDPGWLGHGVQPRFAEQLIGDDQGTLSSLATGRLTLAVGGFRLSDAMEVPYSSQGDRPDGPPAVYAACEHSEAFPNLPGAAVRSVDAMRMNGTSVAAPVFARRAFNMLQGRPRPRRAQDLPRWLKRLVDDVVDAAIDDGTGLVRQRLRRD